MTDANEDKMARISRDIAQFCRGAINLDDAGAVVFHSLMAAVAGERERCAKICDIRLLETPKPSHKPDMAQFNAGARFTCMELAKTIQSDTKAVTKN